MAAVISIVNKPAFPALQNPKSWWQTLPQTPPKGKDKVKTEKFNLLVYLKDLDRAQPGGGKEQKEAAKKIHIVNNAKLTAILHNLIQLGYEYHLDNQKSITAMVPIEGNEEARLVVEEHESLIRLGRTAYDDPNNLKDYIGPGFFAHFNQGLLNDDRGKSDTLDRALNWVDNWAQARYRFMDHYLRDDPRWWVDFHDKTGPGNAANRLVHESCVQGDCDIVDSKWFDVGKRDLFVKVYGMTPEEGRALKACSVSDTRTSYRTFFRWCMEFINQCVNWRLTVLRSRVRKEIDNNKAYGEASTASPTGRRNFKATVFKVAGPELTQADNRYKTLIKHINGMVQDSRNGGQMAANSWNLLNTNITQLSREIKGPTRLNKDCGVPNWNATMRNWPSSVSQWVAPTFPATPAAPTPLSIPGAGGRRARDDNGGGRVPKRLRA